MQVCNSRVVIEQRTLPERSRIIISCPDGTVVEAVLDEVVVDVEFTPLDADTSLLFPSLKHLIPRPLKKARVKIELDY